MKRIVSTSNLKVAAWPIKQILANKEAFQKSLDLRNYKLYNGYDINGLADLHHRLQAARHDRQAIVTARNRLLKQVKGNISVKDSLQGELLEKSKSLKQETIASEKLVEALEAEYTNVVDSVPNLLAPSAAAINGEFQEVEQMNTDSLIASDPSRSHITIGKKLGLIDLESAARVSGSGFYYLTGEGALLEQALVQYALRKCQDAGFGIVSPPVLVREDFVNACGFKPRDEAETAQIYKVTGGGGENAAPLCMAGTAEIPLAGYMAHRSIQPNATVKRAGVSRSYRAEAGARGADTKGLYRVHEFTKVEMFMWTQGDEHVSSSSLKELVELQKDIVRDLELPVRIIDIGPTDLGAPAYQKYDIEAWMPGRGGWGEISSASNCLDFQSRRMHTTDTDGKFVHTLNGTALAVPRIIVALLENGWDGERVRLPKALRAYMPEYLSAPVDEVV